MFEIFEQHALAGFSGESDSDDELLRPLIELFELELFELKKPRLVKKIELPLEFRRATTLKEMRETCGLTLAEVALCTKMRKEWLELFEADQFERVAELTSVSYCEFYLKALLREYSTKPVFAHDSRRFFTLKENLGLFLRKRLKPQQVDYRSLRKHLGRFYFTRAAI